MTFPVASPELLLSLDCSLLRKRGCDTAPSPWYKEKQMTMMLTVMMLLEKTETEVVRETNPSTINPLKKP
jgi:hypothetical protein